MKKLNTQYDHSEETGGTVYQMGGCCSCSCCCSSCVVTTITASAINGKKAYETAKTKNEQNMGETELERSSAPEWWATAAFLVLPGIFVLYGFLLWGMAEIGFNDEAFLILSLCLPLSYGAALFLLKRRLDFSTKWIVWNVVITVGFCILEFFAWGMLIGGALP